MLPTHKFLLNLKYREDRLKEFKENTKDFPSLSNIQVVEAISGDRCNPPESWSAGNGAWGCYRSHLRVLEECLNSRIGSYLIFEDDAKFNPDFEEKANLFFDNLPEDWDQAYLGGQLIHANNRPPFQVNDYVYRPFNVNRTHCFAVSRSGMQKIYSHICNLPFHPREHIDHHLGRLHEDFDFKVYCPPVWMVGQHGDSSNVSGKREEVNFFPNPITYSKSHWLYTKPCCVLFKCSPTLRKGTEPFLHFGNSVDNNGYDVTLTEASKYKYPRAKITEWYNWIRAECVGNNRIPAAYHPFLSPELLSDSGVHHILVLEHQSTLEEIQAQVQQFVKGLKE